MKRLILLFICFLCFLPVSADEGTWEPLFTETFESADYGWPIGPAAEGALEISRSVSDGNYIWEVTTPDPNVTFLALPPEYPQNAERFRFSTEIRLPDFTPYACAGILFDGGTDSFNAYMVCNDKTYGLLQYQNGALTSAIPFTALPDYDSFAPSEISVEINNGWADLYYGEKSLDTFNTGFNYGKAGLIAMPQSTEKTAFRFGSLKIESNDAPLENRFAAEELDANIPESMARLIKMLNMKDRMNASAGTYQSFEEKELSLASMGYFLREGLPVETSDLILQSDIDYASAYEHPDYANSGCGFFIRDMGSDNYLEVYAAMDGAIYLNAYRYGNKIPIMSWSYANYNVEGSGKLGIATGENMITVLWNDAILGTVTNATWMGTGTIGYLLHSGTNADYGTRCHYRNTEAYLFK